MPHIHNPLPSSQVYTFRDVHHSNSQINDLLQMTLLFSLITVRYVIFHSKESVHCTPRSLGVGGDQGMFDTYMCIYGAVCMTCDVYGCFDYISIVCAPLVSPMPMEMGRMMSEAHDLE